MDESGGSMKPEDDSKAGPQTRSRRSGRANSSSGKAMRKRGSNMTPEEREGKRARTREQYRQKRSSVDSELQTKQEAQLARKREASRLTRALVRSGLSEEECQARDRERKALQRVSVRGTNLSKESISLEQGTQGEEEEQGTSKRSLFQDTQKLEQTRAKSRNYMRQFRMMGKQGALTEDRQKRYLLQKERDRERKRAMRAAMTPEQRMEQQQKGILDSAHTMAKMDEKRRRARRISEKIKKHAILEKETPEEKEARKVKVLESNKSKVNMDPETKKNYLEKRRQQARERTQRCKEDPEKLEKLRKTWRENKRLERIKKRPKHFAKHEPKVSNSGTCALQASSRCGGHYETASSSQHQYDSRYVGVDEPRHSPAGVENDKETLEETEARKVNARESRQRKYVKKSMDPKRKKAYSEKHWQYKKRIQRSKQDSMNQLQSKTCNIRSSFSLSPLPVEFQPFEQQHSQESDEDIDCSSTCAMQGSSGDDDEDRNETATRSASSQHEHDNRFVGADDHNFSPAHSPARVGNEEQSNNLQHVGDGIRDTIRVTRARALLANEPRKLAGQPECGKRRSSGRAKGRTKWAFEVDNEGERNGVENEALKLSGKNGNTKEEKKRKKFEDSADDEMEEEVVEFEDRKSDDPTGVGVKKKKIFRRKTNYERVANTEEDKD